MSLITAKKHDRSNFKLVLKTTSTQFFSNLREFTDQSVGESGLIY